MGPCSGLSLWWTFETDNVVKGQRPYQSTERKGNVPMTHNKMQVDVLVREIKKQSYTDQHGCTLIQLRKVPRTK